MARGGAIVLPSMQGQTLIRVWSVIVLNEVRKKKLLF
jgi:hypothetical protein